jgi:hypothetical protein
MDCPVRALIEKMKDTAMTHSRVTPQGRSMGKNAARLAELGRRRLEADGLTNLNMPMLRDEMCKSCACQPGSVPNGCLQTQMDLLKSAVEGKPFLCHAPLDGRMCAGWVRARSELVANPLPTQATALLEKWEYSPPDDVSPNA